MEVNYYRDDLVKNWIENLEEIKYFDCAIEPEYYGEPDNPEYDLFIRIVDNYNDVLVISIPLNSNSNPYVGLYQHRLNIEISFEGDISICDSVLKLIKKFPDMI